MAELPARRSLRVARRFSGHGLADPIFDGHAHLFQSPLKKVIPGCDANQLLGIGESIYQRFEFTRRTKLIARAADKDLGLMTSAQEFKIIEAVFDGNGGQAESNKRADAVI